MGWENGDRTVIINLPPGYDPNTGHPLLLVLHGGNQSAPAYWEKKAALIAATDNAGMVIVFPEGIGDGTNHVWNSWNKAETVADDVGFLSALISWLVDGLSLNGNRVFLSGFSNGAAMTQRFIAEKPELIAGAAAVCHSTGLIEPEPGLPLCGTCTEVCDPVCVQVNDGLQYNIPTPKAPVHLFVIRGGKDDKVCPNGGCSLKGEDRRHGTDPV